MVQGGLLQEKPGDAGYWTYPTKSNTAPSNVLSATGTNNANYLASPIPTLAIYTDPTNHLTPVGAFAASPGPYGTYDMGGDVWQWNEANFLTASFVECMAEVGRTEFPNLADVR